MKPLPGRFAALFAPAVASLLLPLPSRAVDGVIEINQARAIAGGTTPGDAALFPVTLSVGGSYRLTSDLTVPDANSTAILITASDVTIDLNGKTIKGTTVCTKPEGGDVSCLNIGTGVGIDGSTTGVNNVTVGNGTVRGMGAIGISLNDGARVEHVRAISNGGDGIYVNDRCTLTENTAYLNNGSGLIGNRYCAVNHNVSSSNQCDGVEAFHGSVMIGNTGFDSKDCDGVDCGDACTLIGNVGYRNGDNGVEAGDGCTFRDNVAHENLFNGIDADSTSTVIGNTAWGNAFDGIFVGPGSTVVNNTVSTPPIGNGLNLGLNTGYAGNVISGDGPTTVTGSGTEIGTNLCKGVPACP